MKTRHLSDLLSMWRVTCHIYRSVAALNLLDLSTAFDGNISSNTGKLSGVCLWQKGKKPYPGLGHTKETELGT